MAEYRCPHEWSEWVEWLAAGLHGRCRWRLPILLTGILFARGRRTVASWLRAAGIGDGWKAYYYFISAVGRKTESLAARLLELLLVRLPTGPRLVFALDDTPTKRYGPQVEGAGIHHNPTPGPADAKYVYGHIWVTLALIVRHALWDTIGLPLLAKLYIRAQDIEKLPRYYRWQFQTKLQQAAALIRWAADLAAAAGKRLGIVADGFYAKRPVFKAARALGTVLIGRLRKDAALWTLPPPLKKGQPVRKKVKTFLATYRPAYGTIRVVIVQEPTGCQFFFSLDPAVCAEEILELFADRAAIEQDFHDLKEVWGAGQQQVRHLWAWNQSKKRICDRRDAPWDDPERRPSHADRRKALRRRTLREEYSTTARGWQLPRKIRAVVQKLFNLAG